MKRSRGLPLSTELKELVIKKITLLGGNLETSEVSRGTYTLVAKELLLHQTTVKNTWTQFCVTKSVAKRKYIRYKPGKLHEDHKRYIEFLVRETPSISLGDIRTKLQEYCDLTISKVAISYYLKSISTRKRLTRPALEGFGNQNLVYMQVFIDVLSRTDVSRIKFFDESGFARPDVCNPRYGRSEKGQRAVEIHPHTKTANITLNLLVGINGVCYANILQGASDSDTYMDFFFAAASATTNQGDNALNPGDLVIVDNCPIHHHRAERVLSVFLGMHGIEYIFTPTYSPYLNPVELCFQHIKTLFKTEHIRNIARDNLEYAIMYCVNKVSPSDTRGYFGHVAYMNV